MKVTFTLFNNLLHATASPLKRPVRRALAPYFALLCLFLLTACPASGPTCVDANDFGNEVYSELTLEANYDGWVPSGVTVENGAPLKISVDGAIGLCPSNYTQNTYDPTSHTGSGSTAVGKWLDTGVTITASDYISFTVGGAYAELDSDSCTATQSTKQWWDNDCFATEGRGLFVLITSSDPNSNSTYKDSGFWKDPRTYNDKEFFELYDYENDEPVTNVYPGVAGKVWLRYVENNRYRDANNLAQSPSASGDNPFKGTYNNNDRTLNGKGGGYTVNVSKSCMGLEGRFLKGLIGDPSDITQSVIIDMHGTADDEDEPGVYFDTSVERKSAGGGLWFKIFDDPTGDWDGTGGVALGDGEYTDPENIGEYRVTIETLKDSSGFSNFLNAIIDPIRKEFLLGDGSQLSVAETVYRRLLGDTSAPNFILRTLTLMLVLYIILYGIQFILGTIEDTRTDFVKRVFKIGIIIALMQPDSWAFFHTYLFSLFIEGTEDLMGMMTGQFSTMLTYGGSIDFSSVDTQDPFSFTNLTMAYFFSQSSWIKISALLFSDPLGWLYIILIIIGMFYYVLAVLKAVMLYLMCTIATALLLAMAPIFLALLLFEKTKAFFENWIKNLISFALQPLLVLVALSIFNLFVYSALYTILNFEACWKCLIEVDLDFLGFLDDIGIPSSFCIFKFYAPTGDGGSSPLSFFTIITFMLISNAMLKFSDWMAQIAAVMAGNPNTNLMAHAGSTLGSGVRNTASIGMMTTRAGLKAASMAFRAITSAFRR